MSNKIVYVIGAGITGLLSAYYLAKEGYEVTVLEKERYVAQKCSYANGGQVSASNSEVWNTPSGIKKGIKWAFKQDAPLYYNFKHISIDKLIWTSKFLFESRNHRRNTIETLKLAQESKVAYDELIDEEYLYNKIAVNSTILHIYNNQEEFNFAKDRSRLFLDYQLSYTEYEDFKRIRTHSDFTFDIALFCKELQYILTSKYNVRFSQVEVAHLPVWAENALVVVCAGVYSKSLAKQAGHKLDIYPVKGYSITIHDVPEGLLPDYGIIDDAAKIVTSSYKNELRVAGTAEFSGINYDIPRNRIQPLLDWVEINFPEINASKYSQWACLRPMTPSMLPILRREGNIIYNTGHGHLGQTLAAGSAKRMMELI